jgi:hypothetical protein
MSHQWNHEYNNGREMRIPGLEELDMRHRWTSETGHYYVTPMYKRDMNTGRRNSAIEYHTDTAKRDRRQRRKCETGYYDLSINQEKK